MAMPRASPTEYEIWMWTLAEFGLEPSDVKLVERRGVPEGAIPKNIITLLRDPRASHDYLRMAIIGHISSGRLQNRDPDKHTIVKNFKKHYRIWDRIQRDFKLVAIRPPQDESYWLKVVRDSRGRMISHGKKRPR